MTQPFSNLNPHLVWEYFGQITQVPRPSKKEDKIIAYLLEFAKQQGLPCKKDELGNILITKPATSGYETLPPVVLQSHVDMVCEKNNDVVHNFDTDPIQAYVDGDWVKARGTTLGADDGIGVAVQLALLASKDVNHGPLECLFTIDEETGLSGAFGLKDNFFNSRILINLDSEDWGEIFIGCAGGKDTVITFDYKKEQIPASSVAFRIDVKGLKGGHSGDDIHRGLGNAVKIINRLLWEAQDLFQLRIAHIDGGNLRNALAREAFAIVVVPAAKESEFRAYVADFDKIVRNELSINAPELSVTIVKTDLPDFVIDSDTQFRLLNSLYVCPHGVLAWSASIEGLVETSTNLASVKMKEQITIQTSHRSSIESSLLDTAYLVQSVFRLAGTNYKTGEGYPGWEPNLKSAVLDVARSSYKRLFNSEPKVRAIHAGLECGLIGKKYPGIDMISIGPTVKGVHSPDEMLNIQSVSLFWDFICDILIHMPAIE